MQIAWIYFFKLKNFEKKYIAEELSASLTQSGYGILRRPMNFWVGVTTAGNLVTHITLSSCKTRHNMNETVYNVINVNKISLVWSACVVSANSRE